MNVFDLVATLKLDSADYDNALNNAKSNAEGFGSKAKTVLKGTAAAAASAVAAVGAAATATTVKIAKDAYSAYASYEQLTGGIETLFGTGGKHLTQFASTVKATARDIEDSGIDWDKYADTAWMKEGGGVDSMFDEMKNSLENLGTSAEELQEYLHFEYDLDMDDAKKAIEAYQNATSIDTVISKYESAERANEQMLKNASKAYKTAGISANEYMEISIQSAAALINSLGGDQEKAAELMDMSIIDMSDNVNKMGTSMEAVQNAYRGFSRGNFTMLDNLALGFAGTKEGMEELLASAQEFSGIEYDIDSYSDIVEAIHVVQQQMGIAGTTAKEASSTIEGASNATKAAWENVVAAIGGAGDIGEAFDGLINSIFGDGSEGSGLMEQIIPRIEKIMDGIGKFLEKAAPYIEKYLPPLIERIMTAAGPAISSTVSVLLPAIKEIASTIFDTLKAALEEKFPKLMSVLEALKPIGETLLAIFAGTKIISGITTLVTTIQGFAALFASGGAVATAFSAIGTLLTGTVLPAIGSVIVAIGPFIAIAAAVVAAVVGIIAIVKNWDKITAWFSEKWGQFTDWIGEKFDRAKETVSAGWDALKQGASEKWGKIKETISGVMTKLDEKTGGVLSSMAKAWQENGGGIQGTVAAWKAGVTTHFTNLFNTLNNATGGRLGELAGKFKEKFEEIKTNVANVITNMISGALTWGKDLIQNFINGITEKWNALKDTISNVAQTVKDFIGFSEPKKGPLSNFHTYAPDMMDLFAKGIRDNEDMLTDTVASAFDFGDLVTDVGSFSTYRGKNFNASGSDSSDLLETVMSALQGITVEVNIGTERLDGIVSKAIQRSNYRSGGR